MRRVLLQQRVDLAPGADVDPARGLRQHQHVDVAVQHAPEHHLLLVAPRQRGDAAARRRGAHVVALDRGPHAAALRPRVDQAAVRQRARPGHGEVLRDAARRQQRSALAVLGQEADPARQRRPRAGEVGGAAEHADAPLARDRASQRESQLGLARADKPGDAEDLPAAHAERASPSAARRACAAPRPRAPSPRARRGACDRGRPPAGRPSGERARPRGWREAPRRRRACRPGAPSPSSRRGRARACGARSGAPRRSASASARPPPAAAASQRPTASWWPRRGSETRAGEETARAISTSCCSSTDSSPTGRRSSTRTSRPSRTSRASARSLAQSMRPMRARGSRPMNTFSATLRVGASVSSWLIETMPNSSACFGERSVRSTPSTSIRPASGAQGAGGDSRERRLPGAVLAGERRARPPRAA